MEKAQRPGDDANRAYEKLEELLRNFAAELPADDLRVRVRALVPVFHGLRRLGRSLLPHDLAAESAAKERILFYFRKYPRIVISGDELLVVSGIQEYARRIRELRREQGWAVASGYTITEMRREDEEEVPSDLWGMKPSDYVLLHGEQDREAAFRWKQANEIRKSPGSVRDKILRFLRENVGRGVTGEELRYLSKDKTEWARRVRELRTEHGWPIVTKSTGRPDLDVGVYLLEVDRQSPEHDRKIKDPVRRLVLRRDGYKCSECGWSHAEWNRSDARLLELHHVKHHAAGGENDADNLRALCNVCHDREHSKKN
jgi:hypothetical protein